MIFGALLLITGNQSNITQNLIAESVDKKIWSICYTTNELPSVINHFISISDEEKL